MIQGVLRQITPSTEERAAMDTAVSALLAAASESMARHQIRGEATVQGSVAKDTWMAGSADVDMFLLLDASLDADAMHRAVRKVGKDILESPQEKYAQHPYLIGQAHGMQVDLVPCYRVEAGDQKMSAVDRTPFHTAWVNEHLDASLRGDVRLAKAWAKGTGVYGADTATGGFSGYLLEVLVIQFQGFNGLLTWLADSEAPRVFAELEPAPLVVPDPVDASRNCAAAVRDDVLAFATEAASAYIAGPDEAFFFPSPPTVAPAPELNRALVQHQLRWAGLELVAHADRLDIVLPQFHRGARMLAEGMERHGFQVLDTKVVEVEGRIGMQWLVSGTPLPTTRIHLGPSADKEPNGRRFREKWEGHADVAAPIAVQDGRLAVELHVRHREPAEWLAAHLHLATGKHVQRSMKEPHVVEAPGDVSGFWAPQVTDFVLRRLPWQRP